MDKEQIEGLDKIEAALFADNIIFVENPWKLIMSDEGMATLIYKHLWYLYIPATIN